MKKFLKIMTILSGILMVLLVLLYAAAMIIVNRKADSMMTPEMRADYEIFTKEKRQYDPADIYPEPFSDETIALADAFMDEWEKPATLDACTSFSTVYDAYREELYTVQNASAETTQSLTETTTTLADVEETAKTLRPMMEYGRRLFEQDDYLLDLSGVMITRRNYRVPGGSPFAFFGLHFWGVLQYDSLRSIENNRADAAMDTIELALLGLRNHHYASDLDRSLTFEQCFNFYPLWFRAVQICEDVERLEKSLKVQKQAALKDIDFPEGYHDIEYTILSYVRQFSRFGIQKDVQGRTLMDNMEETLLEWPQDYYEEVIAPFVPVADQKEIASRYELDPVDKTMNSLYPLLRPIGKKALYVVFTKDGYNDRYNNHAVFKNAQAFCDILLIQTAARMYELEAGTFPETTDLLVPKYLDKVPMDVYTDRKKPYLRSGNRWYSVAYDGKDDKMTKSVLDYLSPGIMSPYGGVRNDDAVQPGDLFFGLPVRGE